MTKVYSDIFYESPDGLTLYARDYGPNSDKPVLLCLHGLSRNSADFHELALYLRSDFRIISVDQRGRGRSDYDSNTDNYRPDIYCGDMFALLEHLNLKEVIAIGTSMGGIMTMMMAAMRPSIFRAAIINDIGPEIDDAGLNRIKGYVGKTGVFESWDAAVAALKDQGQDIFLDFTDTDWLAFAHRTCEPIEGGQVKFAYDPAISKPFKSDDTASAPVDMWPIFAALNPIPVMTIRGQGSDILSSKTLSAMQKAHPNFTAVEIPRVGHAPLLTEHESLLAIDRFLKAFL
ncbi:pimeloyl-ACP methyl ester carboxylesterase [Litorimonas taeanensis]|uniref:Pimeloyl-ACP methyl ester carboxylesterase n=1 Tax=Litorimonas taeanensis TaxID=568099 RepID=A0A420WLL4_9PROT|nr:alpha/beta hydrolase [Litorimonas taeanensis]RKQ71880.1 pimeloyl-ACP methyl ester carboxylesterase [Litorimonas taeanensis]